MGRPPRLRDADGTEYDPETGERKCALGPCSTFCVNGRLHGGGACPECNVYEFIDECVEMACELEAKSRPAGSILATDLAHVVVPAYGEGDPYIADEAKAAEIEAALERQRDANGEENDA